MLLNNTSLYSVTRGFNWTWRAYASTIHKQHWTIKNLYIISNDASLSDAFTNVEPHQDFCGHQTIPYCVLSKVINTNALGHVQRGKKKKKSCALQIENHMKLD